MTDYCADCGEPLSDSDHLLQFTLPDPVIAAGIAADSDDLFFAGPTPAHSDFLVARDVGYFVRALLSISVTDGHVLGYGVWIEVEPEDLVRANEAWGKQDYGALVIEGRLANAISPWDVLGADVRAEVRDLESLPYCVSSTQSSLSALLSDLWPHDLVVPTPRAH